MPHFRTTLTTLSLLFLLLGLCLTPLSAQAEDALAQLRAKAATIRSVQSDFTQETRIPMFKEALRSQGRFLFEKPHSLRWEYLSPVQEGFALRGDTGFRWQDGSKNRTPFTPGTDPVATIIARQLIAWITFDVSSIEREYRITAVPATASATASQPTATPDSAAAQAAAARAKGSLRLQMTPLRDDLAAIIQSITITFTPEGPASQVELKETRGGSTVINFTNTLVNGPVNAEAFR